MKKITLLFLALTAMFNVANAQDITVFDFDGTTPVFSSWSDSFVSVANPVSDGVNGSVNVGKYTHNNMWSEITIDLATPIDSRIYTSFQFKVYSPAAGRLIVGCKNTTNSVTTTLSEYNTVQSVTAGWTTITQNITTLKPITKIFFSFQLGTAPAGDATDVIYLDDLRFIKATVPVLYFENFEADLAWDASSTVTPSTKAGKWNGGVDLETAGDADITLEQSWSSHDRVLRLTPTDVAVIIPNINVAGFDNLKLSLDIHDESEKPIIDVKVGNGDWVSVATPSQSWSWTWKNFVLSLKDATENPISNVSTISLRFSPPAANSLIYDNIKILGNVHCEFTGATSTDPTVSANWSGGFVPGSTDDVTISGGTMVLNQNATYNSVTVNPTAKLTLNDTKSLTVSSLLLKSDATGTATFVDENTTPSAVTAIVKQYLPATNRNWYLSSPIASATNGNLSTGAGVVEYNEELGTWSTVSGTLAPMKGYISTAGSAGTGTLSFSGNLNSGSKSIALSKKGSTSAGFNLVGNPYPSYLNWTETLANSANCSTTIWYRTNSAGVYSFQTYNASSGIGVPSTTSEYIPPMQAFWVRTSVDGSTLAINNSARSHGDGSSNLLKKSAGAVKITGQLVRLQVSNGSNTDETVIYSNPNADNGFDNYDSPKMLANNVNVPEIFTMSGTEKLVINGMKTITENTEIPVGFATGTSNKFTLVATELKNLESGTHIILKDNLLNKENELTEGITYNFSSDVTTPGTGRFSLIFRTTESTTGISENNLLDKQVFVNSENMIVIATSKKCNYTIYNSIGQKVNEGFTSGNPTIVPGKYKPGIYIVKLSGDSLNYSSKVIIK